MPNLPKDTSATTKPITPLHPKNPRWLTKGKDPYIEVKREGADMIAGLEKNEAVTNAAQAMKHAENAMAETVGMLVLIHSNPKTDYTDDENKLLDTLGAIEDKRNAEFNATIKKTLVDNHQTEQFDRLVKKMGDLDIGPDQVMGTLQQIIIDDGQPKAALKAPDIKHDPHFNGNPNAPQPRWQAAGISKGTIIV